MFSFFKKKQPFSVRIKEYDSVRLIAGMEITTCRKSMKKDVSQLQKKVQQHQSELRELSNPSGTMVISTTPDETGNFSYFLGAWVDIEEQEPPFIVKKLQPGLYAHIQVDFSVPENLTLNVAKAKHYFFENGFRTPVTRWLTALIPSSCTTAAARLGFLPSTSFFPWKRNNL